MKLLSFFADFFNDFSTGEVSTASAAGSFRGCCYQWQGSRSPRGLDGGWNSKLQGEKDGRLGVGRWRFRTNLGKIRGILKRKGAQRRSYVLIGGWILLDVRHQFLFLHFLELFFLAPFPEEMENTHFVCIVVIYEGCSSWWGRQRDHPWWDSMCTPILRSCEKVLPSETVCKNPESSSFKISKHIQVPESEDALRFLVAQQISVDLRCVKLRVFTPPVCKLYWDHFDVQFLPLQRWEVVDPAIDTLSVKSCQVSLFWENSPDVEWPNDPWYPTPASRCQWINYSTFWTDLAH